MRKSVAILGTRGYPSYYGGFETLVRYLAPYLAERNWDVTVYGRRGAVDFDDPHRDPEVTSVLTGGFNSRSFSTISHGLTASIATIRKKPDVALVMNVANGLFFPLISAMKVPIVVNVDGIEWEREKWGFLARTAFKTGAGLTARYASTLVFDSQAVGVIWENRFGRSGVYIPYGGERRDELPFREKFQQGKYVLLVARFVPENSIAEFFQAVPEIARFADVVIVGAAGHGGHFDSLARKLDGDFENVYFLGHINDDNRLHALWQNAAVYFHGHSVGGTNPALVQAMALGTPIVARDTVFNREVLTDLGMYFGLNSNEIVEEIRKVYFLENQARLGLRSNLLKRSSLFFTWKGVCKRYALALEEAVDSAPLLRNLE